MIKIYAVIMSDSIPLSLDIFRDKSNQLFTPTLSSQMFMTYNSLLPQWFCMKALLFTICSDFATDVVSVLRTDCNITGLILYFIRIFALLPCSSIELSPASYTTLVAITFYYHKSQEIDIALFFSSSGTYLELLRSNRGGMSQNGMDTSMLWITKKKKPKHLHWG